VARKIMPKLTVGWRLAQNHGIAISNLGLVEAVDRSDPRHTEHQDRTTASRPSTAHGTTRLELAA
jgi:hypothetical protein